MKTILITGSSGQLGQCLKQIEADYSNELNLIFKSSKDLDITDHDQLEYFFSNNTIDTCINCAAYTAVDKAEVETSLAKQINKTATENLADLCKKHHIKLIHISTDFVFNGDSSTPYKEEDSTNPISVYGKTKLEGEIAIKDKLDEYYIIRTSWLYSEFGSNFMKTMLRLGRERKELNVVNDQIGTPTYAIDLANVLLKIASSDGKKYGIYHYSNEGRISWYDFAKKIFSLSNLDIKVNPVPSESYKTLAKRPKFSLLDKTKIKKYLQIDIPEWDESLEKAIKKYNEKRDKAGD